MTTLRRPEKVRALVVYEPTLFMLEEAAASPPNGVDGIRNAVELAGQALDAGDTDSAAGHFIDFWMGSGSWALTPAERKPAIAKSIFNVRRWRHALMTEPTPLAAFAALTMQVVYMMGGRCPDSAHAVARRLVPALPLVTELKFIDLGHMAPVTHAETINAVIADYLKKL